MIKFFYKLYLGWELTTSHYMIAAAGKGIETDSGGCQEKRTSEVAADVVDISSRIPYGHEFSEGGRCNVVRSGVVVLLVVPSVRTVRVREWARAPGFLFDARPGLGRQRSELSRHWGSSSTHTRDVPAAPP